MKRVLVVGSGGSGKSTFSVALGQQLDIPVMHLDAMYWQPGWVEPARPAWLAQVEALCRQDLWIMDGNYSGTLAPRLAACDTVVFLDMPRLLCLWRAISRGWRHRGKIRPDMAPGCPEQLPDLSFLSWIWNYPERSRPTVLALLAEQGQRLHVVHLRSPGEARRFLTSLRQARVAGAP